MHTRFLGLERQYTARAGGETCFAKLIAQGGGTKFTCPSDAMCDTSYSYRVQNDGAVPSFTVDNPRYQVTIMNGSSKLDLA